MQRPALAALLAAVLVTACSDTPTAPQLRADEAVAPAISVMTRNVYVGADVDAVILALGTPDPNDDFPALSTAIQTLAATDFPTRAQAFAAEIASGRPHVVGLQEISVIQMDLTPLGMDVKFTLPFLPILLDALAQRGLDYRVGAQVKNIDLTIPLNADASAFVSLADYDVVLYDASRTTWETQVAKTFETNIPPEYVGGLDIRRGWIWGRAGVHGSVYNVVSTHPEPGADGDFTHPLAFLRAAQMTEIAEALGDAAPVVLMGDLNDVPGSPMYEILSGYGFDDTWASLRGNAAGYTCCHLPDLSNPGEAFTKRIDFVFARGLGQANAGLQGQINRVGEVPADRIQGPQYLLWPSDHAGLVAAFLAPPANGLVTE